MTIELHTIEKNIDGETVGGCLLVIEDDLTASEAIQYLFSNDALPLLIRRDEQHRVRILVGERHRELAVAVQQLLAT
jgi:hypothetical protein